MAIPKPSNEVRDYLAAIGAKGGRAFTLKKKAQLAARCQVHGWNASRDIIAAIEGQVRYVTDREILNLAKALKVPFPTLFP